MADSGRQNVYETIPKRHLPTLNFVYSPMIRSRAGVGVGEIWAIQ